MSEQERRQNRLRALAREYVSPGQNSGAEDVAEYLPEGFGPYHYEDPTREIKRWATITQTGDLGYVYPDYDTKTDAQDRAVQFSGDLTYAEMPIGVANLDTGRLWMAHFDRHRVRWIRGTDVEPVEAPEEVAAS